MWLGVKRHAQIEYQDKFGWLTVIKASLVFYDVITAIEKSAGTFHKSQGIFSDLMATASRLNTLYRLDTLYGHLSIHFRIIQKVVRHFRHLWHINDVINVGFLRNFAVLCYDNQCIGSRSILILARNILIELFCLLLITPPR